LAVAGWPGSTVTVCIEEPYRFALAVQLYVPEGTFGIAYRPPLAVLAE
jgi:hypothetical protein